MTNEQPMQPRYLCVSPTDSHYPYSPFKIGDIITMNQISCNGSNCCTINGVVYSDVALDKYPHLFRRLKWWEFRDEKDMPGYVKFQEKVYKVIRYRKPNIIRIIDDFWKTEIWQEIGEPYWLPATAEEYEQFTHPAPGDKQK